MRATRELKAAPGHCQTQKSMTELATPIEAATAIERVAAQRRKIGASASPAIFQPRTMV
jgi:hypothetical protein